MGFTAGEPMQPSIDTMSSQWMRVGTAALRVLSDERLARLAATGDRLAFAVIFDRYHQRLYSYCASLLRNADDAADAVQNTMLRAMRALDGEERGIALRPWLFRIAHNESIELLRGRRAEPAPDAEVVTVSDVEGDAAVRAHLRAVLDDMRALPERQRGALVMRELSGLGYDEIAAALATSEAGAKQAVYDARRALHDLAQGRESDCESIRRKLSDGDRRVFRARAVRAHLTACADCRSWQAELAARQTSWAAFAPTMPAAAAAAALQGAVGGGAGAGAAAAGGFAGVGASATGPAIATIAVAVVLGAGVVGVHELQKEDGGTGTATGPNVEVAAPGTPVASTGKRGDKGRLTGRGDRTGRARGRGRGHGRARGRSDEHGRRGAGRRRGSESGKGDADRKPGAGSTRLGGGAGGTSSSGGRSGGTGIKSWIGGRGGGRDGGPIRSTVDGTRDTFETAVTQVQGTLPVPTPQLPPPVVRPPRGDPPRQGDG